jgi:hypothetical protein
MSNINIRMNTFNKFKQHFIGLVLVSVFVVSCTDTSSNSLFDKNYQSSRPDPIITSVSPSNEYIAGVGQIVITGENFSANPAENFVYFGPNRGTVLSSTNTEIVVRPPNTPSDNLELKVSVLFAEKFSEPREYALKPAISSVPGLENADSPSAVSVGPNGNIYVYNAASNINEGIIQITPDGDRSVYVPPRAWRYNVAKIGPDGRMFMARGGTFAIIYVAPAGGGVDGFFIRNNPATREDIGRVEDFDFDNNDNLWAGGLNAGTNLAGIYRVDVLATTVNEAVVSSVKFDFDADVRAVRYFNNSLYVGAIKDGVKGVWRFPVLANDDLDTPELYFTLPSRYVTGYITAITFTATGEMFVGTNSTTNAPILIVQPGGAESADFYPGVISPTIQSLFWESGTRNLLMTRAGVVNSEGQNVTTPALFRIATFYDGAPNFGIE